MGKRNLFQNVIFPLEISALNRVVSFEGSNFGRGFIISEDALWGLGPHLTRQDLLSPGDGSTADSCHMNSSPRLLFGDKTSLILHIDNPGSRICSNRSLISWGLVMGALPHDVGTGHPLDHSLSQRQQTSPSQAKVWWLAVISKNSSKN